MEKNVLNSRLGFLLTEEDSDKLRVICERREINPYDLIREAINVFYRVEVGARDV